MAQRTFIPSNPTVEDCWRGIILYGQNSATYKFALAESLLKLNPASGDLVKLEDLAPIYGKAIAAHIAHSPKQGTRPGKFLQSVQQFNVDQNLDALVGATVSAGFQDVIDAFHNIGSSPVLHKFFIDERRERKGIRITDAFSELAEGVQVRNIEKEVQSRWRLVETAWNLGVSANHLVVQHDHDLGEIFATDFTRRRRSVTNTRGALNGYQKGRCFYCFTALQLLGNNFNTDVDHFFPQRLKQSNLGVNLDGVWNLVLSCQVCNRGPRGKFDRIPSPSLLERLHERNEFLIGSHHPLRETLINQTGDTTARRRNFLSNLYQATQLSPQLAWEPVEVRQPTSVD